MSMIVALPAPTAVALDQDPRFAGARPGHDQQWSGGVLDRRALRLGERQAGGDHRGNRLPDPPLDAAGTPSCRNRISRTAEAPIASFNRSINIVRSRWS